MIQYIIKALLNDDSIFINDLGTFTKSYQSARFDGNTMLPPQYVVTLTVKDDQPDSTEFINLVCREKQCRITEASAEINQWVEELKTAIENNKEVEFDNFGTFSLSNKGVITFVCDHIEELNREFEGMGIVKLGELDEEEEKEEKEVKEVNEVNEVNEVMKDEEMRRLQDEEEERRLQEEAEQRLREAEEQKRLAKEAEEKRLQEEAEQRLREAEEQEKLAKEAEEKRLQEEAEQRLREAEEQERLAKEAEEKVKEDQEVKEVEEEKEVKEVEEVEVVDLGDVVYKDADIDDKKPAKRKKKRRSWWWLIILLILIALGVLGYLFRQQLTDTFHRIKMEFSPTDEEVITEEDEAVHEETATYEEETQEAQEEEVATEPEVYTPEVVRTTANGNYPVIRFEQGHYYVIAGSLPTEQDAVRHIKQRNLDQYEPKIVMQQGANLRVCIGIFDTEEEAETYAKSVNKNYWVLK